MSRKKNSGLQGNSGFGNKILREKYSEKYTWLYFTLKDSFMKSGYNGMKIIFVSRDSVSILKNSNFYKLYIPSKEINTKSIDVTYGPISLVKIIWN